MRTDDIGRSIPSRKAMHCGGEELSKLFDRQIAMLQRRGCPPHITEKLRSQRSNVIFGVSPSKKPLLIPFLPVIPQRYLTVYSQMSMLRNNEYKGQTGLDLSDFDDLDATPQEPYYIYGVDKGDMNAILRTGRTVEEESYIITGISSARRNCLTIVEAIALALQSDVLKYCLVRPYASKYKLFLGINVNDAPVLELHPEAILYDWCVPSYKFRKCYSR